ncbi:MAG: polyphosphate polymerase domain-containing protein [Chitinophagales bacterium]|nr:polyphosphate polymerase domain-containing protein [Chitinophagales bacterium]
MRYERKYKLPEMNASVVHEAIRMHPACFRELYPPRWVNNIYFDTPDFTAFNDNIAGVSHRRKYRIRWYGRPVENISKPRLEIKIKENEVGRKESFLLSSAFANLSDADTLISEARKLLGSGTELQAVLLNSYFRSYWGTSNGKFRLTVDSQLQYGATRFSPSSHFLTYRDEGTVLEVKYPVALSKESDFIAQYLPFRQTKSSKYVTGIYKVYS